MSACELVHFHSHGVFSPLLYVRAQLADKVPLLPFQLCLFRLDLIHGSSSKCSQSRIQGRERSALQLGLIILKEEVCFLFVCCCCCCCFWSETPRFHSY